MIKAGYLNAAADIVYSSESIDYIAERRLAILEAASAIGVSVTAIAGAIAEELTALDVDDEILDLYAASNIDPIIAAAALPAAIDGGAHEIAEWKEDNINQLMSTRRSHAEWVADYQATTGMEHPTLLQKIEHPILIDVGPGNFRISTAISMVKKYANKYPSLGLSIYLNDYSLLVDHLMDKTNKLTPVLYGLYLKEDAETFFARKGAYGGQWNVLPQELRDALLITFTNRGLDSMEKSWQEIYVNKGLPYEPLPGLTLSGGMSHLLNAQAIGNALGLSSYGGSLSALTTFAVGAASSGEEGLAYRYALYRMRYVAIPGLDYSAYNAVLSLYDPETDTGEMTSEYIANRANAVMLYTHALRTGAGEQINLGGLPFAEWGDTYVKDISSGWSTTVDGLDLGIADTHRVVFGGASADFVFGGAAEDRLYGGGGNDSLNGAKDDDYLEGNGGDDRLYGDENSDTLNGGDGSDRLEGGNGIDVLFGGTGDDTVLGGIGNDQLKGGKGHDQYAFDRGDGADLINDIDGVGSVVIGGVAMLGGKREEDRPYFEDKATGTVYQWFGSTLTIVRKGFAGQVTVQDWSNGELGIRLVEDIKKPKPVTSPIVVDLDGDGIKTTGLLSQVHFDHDDDDFLELTGWVGAGDGLLVRDFGDDGRIDSGKELFGSETRLTGDVKAAHGFAALATLDADGNNAVTGEEMSVLKVWRDDNQNGLVDSGELLSMEAAGIRSLSTQFKTSAIVDEFGNAHKQIGSYVAADGATRSLVDVWFKTDRADSIAVAGTTELPADVKNLPDIEGYGTVKSLHQAMAQDAQLKQLVQSFGSTTDEGLRATLVRDILWQWAGVTSKLPNSRGGYIKEARWLYMVEAFTGTPFVQASGTNGGTPNPGPAAADDIYLVSKSLYERMYSKLMAQTHLEAIYENMPVVWDETTQAFDVDVAHVINQVLQAAGDDQSAGLTLLNQTMRSLRGQSLATQGVVDDLLAGLSSMGSTAEAIIRSNHVTGLGLDTASTRAGNDVMTGAAGNDTLYGEGGNDGLYGKEGHDELIGGHGDDELDGGAGNDRLYGNDGADTYRFGIGYGQDTVYNIDGQALNVQPDTVRMQVNESQVTASRVGDDVLLGIVNTSDQLRISGYFSKDEGGNQIVETIQFLDGKSWSVAQINEKLLVATSGNDYLVGQTLDDVISSAGGNDRVFGLEGNDSLSGNEGDDELFGDAGLDTLTGGAGQDLTDGGLGDDTYRFGLGDGHDTIREGLYGNGGGGDDTVLIRSGVNASDVRVSRDRNDLILALPGKTVNQQYVYDSVRLQGVLDLEGTAPYKIEKVRFEDGGVVWTLADLKTRLLAGGDTDDVLQGYETPDELRGNGGNDTLIGNGGSDNLNGDAGRDSLVGGAGDDRLDGGTGADTLSGDAGHNYYILKEGSEDDVVKASYSQALGTIDTVLIPASIGLDNVEVIRIGNDITFRIKGTQDSIRFEGVMGNDGLYGGYSFQYGVQGGATVNLAALKTALLRSTSGNDHLIGYATSDSIDGGAGNDTIQGRGGEDTLRGGTGNDLLLLGSSANTVMFSIGDGQDTLEVDGERPADAKVNTLQFGEGVGPSQLVLNSLANGKLTIAISGTSDVITVDDFIFGGDTANRWNSLQAIKFADGTSWDLSQIKSKLFSGSTGADTIYGSLLADTIKGAGSGDLIHAEHGNDLIEGGDGHDRLFGNSGDDTLDGGRGNDTLQGDGGNYSYIGKNTFLFGLNDGIDLIELGSNGSQNTLLFKSGILPGSVAMAYDDWDLILTLNATDKVIIQNFFYDDDPVSASNTLRQIKFTDSPATVWTAQSISAAMIAGSDSDQSIIAYRTNDSISALGGADSVLAMAGADTVDGGNGRDTLRGGAGNDSLLGGADTDRLYGDDGSDTLDGGLGNDTVNGGFGNDTYLYGRGDGADYISNSVETTTSPLSNVLRFKAGILPGDVAVSRSEENLLLTLTGGDSLVVESFFHNNDPANLWSPVQQLAFDNGVTWDFAKILQLLSGTATGSSGAELITGQAGPDKLDGAGGNDTIYGGAGIDSLYGGTGNDHVFGDADGDRLYGGDGDDTLEGGTGADTLNGGLGNDTYVFGKGHGTDYLSNTDDLSANRSNTIQFKADIAASAIAAVRNAETLVLTVTGSTGDKVMVESFFYNNDPLNTLNPVQQLAFADGSRWGTSAIRQFTDAILLSGAGTVSGSSSANKIYGGATGDTVSALAGNDFLFGAAGNDSLDGGADNDWLYGGDDVDTLNGGAGIDTMSGGFGSDIYHVDNSADLIVEEVSGGALDEVYSSVTYTVGDTIEYAELTGTANTNLTGGNNGVQLWGNAGSNVMTGGQGSDELAGGVGGIDTLVGRQGDDVYIILNVTDVVTESAGEGFDEARVMASTHRLGEHVENLTLLSHNSIGTGNGGDNGLFGSAGANTLSGLTGDDFLSAYAGNDTLTGGLGDDTLSGGTGNDTYVYDNGDGWDLISNYDAGGTDSLLIRGATESQIWFKRQGKNLSISIIGTDGDITMSNWASSAYQIDTIKLDNGKTLTAANVINLVNAMAEFTQPSMGQTTLPADYQTALGSVISQNWVAA